MKIDIRWTNSLCRKAGLSLAALLLFVIALSTAVSKSRASDENDSSSAAESSSQAPVIKYDTRYEQMNNSAFEENSGLLALDSKDRRYASEGTDFDSIYPYLFNDKGDQIMTTSSTSVCGEKEMLTQLNKMVSDFSAQTGLKTIMVRNASFKTNDKLYPSQFDVEDKKDEKTAAADKGTVSSDGCYEHLSGLAVDLQLYEADKGAYPQFTGEGQYSWIVENCYKYGFVQRYTAAKQQVTGVEAKADHFRYVGRVFAKIMHDNDLALEEIYAFLQKYSYEQPLSVILDDGSEHIAYCVKADKEKAGTTIPVPSQPDGSSTEYCATGVGDGILYVCAGVPSGTQPRQDQQTTQTQPEKTE